ncbi:hypothetical protein GCM10009865_10810 [Aeromicrobium ponti]|uniref:DUF4829 domain-containing protein n=1 Tax=Cytobacillus oceanisediminis TaxID=665099 RepID=A0A562K2Q2_9BACI|nr:hypothetical protein [Cytobacillus oceanisediminis]TWH89709.1 hypothetical protein IQ19_00955 [Cytobacillus oceanisediminis]
MRHKNTGKILLAIPVFVLTAILLINILFSSPDQHAINAVDEFYSFEQQGEFSSSWGMFHPWMKEKFAKGHYIQDRAHVFMNHFGVDTFSYSLSEPEELKNWKPVKEGPSFKNIYKINVTQTYKGKYGNFDIQQEVFAVKDKDEWTILWDYKK